MRTTERGKASNEWNDSKLTRPRTWQDTSTCTLSHIHRDRLDRNGEATEKDMRGNILQSESLTQTYSPTRGVTRKRTVMLLTATYCTLCAGIQDSTVSKPQIWKMYKEIDRLKQHSSETRP